MTDTKRHDDTRSDRAFDALDLLDLLLDRVDERARRELRRDDDSSTDPWGDQP